MSESAGTPVKSAVRALDIIDFVSARGAATFLDIVEGLALPRSSAHGLLQTLVSSGWLEFRAGERRYGLGLHAWQVAQGYDGHRALTEKAKPIMDALALSTGETVQLARLDGVENVYIAISESPNPMRLASRVGMRLHAHATGIGKALLSAIDREDAQRRLEEVVLPRLTDKTVTDVPGIMALVDRARVLGYAVDDEEFVEGCRCVALPVTAEEESGVVSAISITMPTLRTDERWPHSLYPPLRAAVESIREELGLRAEIRLAPVDHL